MGAAVTSIAIVSPHWGRRFTWTLLLGLLVVTTCGIGLAGADPVSVQPGEDLDGEGTESEPYIITNVSALQAINEDRSAHYVLGNDIDASETATWDGGKGFLPIGEDGSSFSGTVDGQGYTISNLTINRPSSDNVGLFGHASDTELSNIRLEQVEIHGDGRVGGLVGWLDQNSEGTTSVRNVSVEGEIIGGGTYVAGLVGQGFGGRGHGPTLDNENVFIGNITGENQVGGLVGRTSHDTKVGTGYVQGEITATNGAAGGIVGHSSGNPSIIEDVYAAVEVTADDAGAIVGVVGSGDDTFKSNVYWDSTLHTDAAGSEDPEATLDWQSRETDQMVGDAAVDYMDEFDFDNRWAPVTFPEDDYPVFQWQLASHDLNYSELTVSPASLAVGETVEATAILTNEGDDELPYNAAFRIAGSVIDRQEGSLSAGESVELEFSGPVEVTTTGPVEVTIGDIDPNTVTVDELFAGGDGTEAVPYEIANIYQLQAINEHLDSHFVLVTDIDASETESWNDGNGFEPIGTSGSSFTGTFDGQGYTVSNLVIDRPGETYVGLFGAAHSTGSANEMVIQNLHLEDIDVTGLAGSGTSSGGGVGGLLGAIDSTDSPSDARVENVSVSGTVTGLEQSGDSYNVAGVVGAAVEVGGGVGGTLVDQNVFTGTVEADGVNQVGGLIGRTNWNTDVSVGYVNATISGGSQVGGLVGHSSSIQSTFEKMYFVGTVSGSADYGGVVGYIGAGDDVFKQSVYWDTDLEPTGVGFEQGTFDAIGLSTEQMVGEAAETNMDQLDFDARWAPVTFPADDYPVFQWQLLDEDINVTNFEVSPTVMDRGDEITATARITNEGEVETAYNIPFIVDGSVIERSEGSLAPGSFVDIEFTYEITATGDVDVTIDDQDPVSVSVAEEILDVNATNPAAGLDIELAVISTGPLDAFELQLSDDTNNPIDSLTKSDFDEASDNGEYAYTTTYTVSTEGSYTAEIISARDAYDQTLVIGEEATDTVLVADGTAFFACETPAELVDHLIAEDSIEVISVDSTGNCNPAAASFTNFDLGSDHGVDFALPDGIHLSSYRGDVPLENTQPHWGGPNQGARTAETERFYQDVEIAAQVNNPQNAMGIEFEFTTPDGVDAVEFQFMFGSEEYPMYVDSMFTDGAAVMVDGENYAMFPDGTPLKVVSDADFYSNQPQGFGNDPTVDLPIEYNGITAPMRISAPLDTSKESHTVRITIADTFDQAFASGLFISAMAKSNDTSGGIGSIDPADAPSLSTSVGSTEFIALDGPVTVDPDLTVDHPHDITEAEVTFQGGFSAGDGDELVVGDDQGLDIDNTNDGSLRISGTASASDYETVLQSITFETGSTPSETNRTVQFRITEYETGNGEASVIPGASKTIEVEPNDPPAAVLSASHNESGVGDQVDFDASDSSDAVGIDSFTWKVSGTTEYGPAEDLDTITHSFTEDGDYTVTVVVEDTVGQTATDTVQLTVVDNQFTIADAGANQTAGQDETVTLDGSNSEATTQITDYDWDITGDGSIDASGPVVTTSFAEVGTHEVSLHLTEQFGNETQVSTYVTITDTTPPDARISANETIISVGDTVEFDGSDSTDNIDDPSELTYEWDLWGTGTIDASGKTVTHTYGQSASENITIELTVTDSSGNVDTETLEIQIRNSIDPEADAGPDISGTVGETLTFDGSESRDIGEIDTYEWDFGDGSIGFGETPTYSYAEPGTYTVNLTVVDDAGNTNSSSTTATIHPPPTINTSDATPVFEEHRDSVIIDPELAVTGQEIDSAAVYISDGFDANVDTLAVDSAVADAHGISWKYTQETGVLSLWGSADGAAYESVLRSATYTNSADHISGSQRSIQFVLGNETRYLSETGLFYTYVNDPEIAWNDARDGAEDQSYYGLDGHLVTITTEAENDLLQKHFEQGGWIGATDSEEESVWRWVTGPEGLTDDGEGKHFFTQTASQTGSHHSTPVYPNPPTGVPGGGDPVDGSFVNWDLHEPNNKFPQFGGQHYAYFCQGTPGCADGTWMDLDGSHNGEPTPQGYFVQFGGMPADDDVEVQASQTLTIEPRDPPTAVAGEDLEITNIDENEVTFSADGSTSDFDLMSYTWEFEHGGSVEDTRSENQTVKTFSKDGLWTVTLTVVDEVGLTDEDSLAVYVDGDAIIIVDAGGNITVDDGDAVQFDGSNSDAIGGIDSFSWDLGDGTTTTGPTPSHTYDEPGTYDVTLEVTDETYDNTVSTDTTVIIKDITPPVTQGVADPMPAEIGEPITFDASGTTDNVDAASALTYDWDLNGTGQFTHTGKTVTVLYDYLTEANATLRVTDTSGNVNISDVSYSVINTDVPNVDVGDDIEGYVGQQIEFDGSNSTAANGDGISTFTWSVDGNTVATTATANHTFDSTGTYSVKLNVTDTSGNAATETLQVTISEPPALTQSATETPDFVEHLDPIPIDDSLELSYDGTLDGVTVQIVENYDPANDVLAVNASVASTHGVSASFDETRGILTISGTADGNAYEAVLQTVTFETSAVQDDPAPRDISITLGNEIFYLPETNRFYEYVEAPQIRWHDARDAAADRQHFGQQGYLATITTEAENDLLVDTVRGSGWIGATDETEEGTWRWVTGPEGLADDGNGTHFFTQTSSDTGTPLDVYDGTTPGGGTPIDDAYTNWHTNEPNDWGEGEDYAHFCYDLSHCEDGTWNDYDSSDQRIKGYLVGFGGMPGDPSVSISGNYSLTIDPRKTPIADAGEDLEITNIDENEVTFSAVGSTADFDLVSYSWSFEHDGTVEATGDTKDVTHAFTTDGQWTVTLEIEDAAGLVDSTSVSVYVEDEAIMVADAGGNLSVDEGEVVSFDGSNSVAIGSIDSYEWDFDDGSYGSGAEPTHTYTDPGTYDVELTISNTTDDISVTTSTVVHVADITPPIAVATVDESTIGIGEELTFDASGSSDNADTAGSLLYEWDFTSNGQFTETGQTVSQSFHYVTDGEATLRVTDSSGNVNTTTVSYSVENLANPVADAGPNLVAYLGEEIRFDGTDSTDDVGIETFSWDFGDGTATSGPTPNHTYDATGTYAVELSVTDTAGNTDSSSSTIVITEPAVEWFSASLDERQVGIGNETNITVEGSFSTTLDDYSGGNPISTDDVTFESTDSGVASVSPDGTVTAHDAGAVTLTAQVDTSTHNMTLFVGEDGLAVQADVTASSYIIEVGSAVDFRANESRAPDGIDLEFAWEYAGSELGTTEVVSTSFDTPGEHEVNLTISADGVTANETLVIEVEDTTPPSARLAGDSNGDVGDILSFDASHSTDNVEIAEFGWEFGDATTATGPTVSHTYEAPGTYTVNLTVTDTSGNTASNSTTVTVYGPEATVSEDLIDFGTVGIGSSHVESRSVTNTGTAPLELTSIAVTGSDATEFDLHGAASSGSMLIRPGETRSIVVVMEPTSVGQKDASLMIDSNNTGSTQAWTLPLSGTAADGTIAPNQPTISFDDTAIGSQRSKTVRFENTGSGIVQLDSVTLNGSEANQFAIDESSVPDSLAPGAEAPIDVDFSPQTVGDVGATLVVNSDSNPASVSLHGYGEGPQIQVSKTDLSFTTIGADDRTNTDVAIHNYGNKDLDIEDISLTGSEPGEFRIANTIPLIEPDETAALTVWFEPTTAGDPSAEIQIAHNDSGQPTQTIPISGTAIGAEIGIDRRMLDFGNTTVGESVYMNITLTNRASVTANLSLTETAIVGSHPDDFAVARGDAPVTIEPGDQHDLEINFTALQEGEREAQLQIHSDAENEPLINVWISNTRSYLLVQEIGNPSVNVEGRHLNMNSSHTVNVTTPAGQTEPVSLRELDMTMLRDGNFGMDIAYDIDPITYELSSTDDSEILNYINLHHDPAYPESALTFDNTSLLYRVAANSLANGIDPEEVMFHRYNETQDQWIQYPSVYLGQTESDYLYSVEIPGFSAFAVSAPTASQPGAATGGAGGMQQTPIHDDDDEVPPPADEPESTPEAESTPAETPDSDEDRQPTGDVGGDDRWVEPDELEAIRIIEARLETTPVNSVNATILITLENPADQTREAEVRFIRDGLQIDSQDVSLQPGEQLTVRTSEIVTEPGKHIFAANIGTTTDTGELVRTYDFEVGVVELDESGDEIITDPETDCVLFGYDFGSFIVCWYWWVLIFILFLGGWIMYRQKQTVKES